jgi:hypothetical protein
MRATPGPWKIVDKRHQKNGQILIMGGYFDVANVLARNECADANARLIAAAPDLLAACEAALEWHDSVTNSISGGGIPRSGVVAKLRTAIASATGEES